MVRVLLFVLATALAGCAEAPWFRHERSANPSSIEILRQAEVDLSLLDLKIEVIWLSPPVGDPMVVSDYLLVVRGKDGQVAELPENLELFAYGWHTSMGHGSATDGRLEKVSEGIHRNEGLRFNMPGQWELIIQVYEADELLDETSVEVRVL